MDWFKYYEHSKDSLSHDFDNAAAAFERRGTR